MKTNFYKQLLGGVLIFLFCAAVQIHAQPGRGGGGGGFGGFGGFGGGGFGGGGFGGGNRGGTSGNNQYNNNGTVGNAIISVDPVTHNIVVIADRQTSEQIKRVIASLDAPEPQVLIKVVFLEVARNDASEIGVQGTYTGNPFGQSIASLAGYTTNYGINNVYSILSLPTLTSGSGSNSTTTTPPISTTLNGSTLVNNGFLNNTPTVVPKSITPTYQSVNLANSFNLPQSLTGAAGNGGLYQILGNDFTATIQAIAAAGKSQVLSRPSILARDGQLAKIVVGQDVYLPSGVTYITSGTATIPIINGAYTEVGIILNVTPYIGQNGMVEMIVQPQTSAVDTSSPGQLIAAGSSLLGTSSTPVYAPNVNIRSADTVVVTPSGQTVVIGGLISTSKSTATSKVPFLGDIPILGQLFRTTGKAEARNELMMFLTPHIVEAPSQLPTMTNPEMNQAPLLTNSISEQELDRFLERVPVKKSEPLKKKK